VHVRPARPHDARAIAEAHVGSWRATYRGIVPDSILDRLSVDRRAEFWRQVIEARGDERMWVGIGDGDVVGFASTGPARDEELAPGAGEVYAIYLAPDWWSRGLGRELFAAAVADLRERRLAPLVLWVLTLNARGRRFYEAAGWQPDGAARNLDFDGTAVEEIRYRAG
jgi:GNAT superfamily N-acetyltransferase